MTVNPIPKRYRAAIPYLNVLDGNAAIKFYERAFGARFDVQLPRPDGKLAHAEMRIGDALVMVRNEIPELDFRSPAATAGSPVQILIYVEDASALVERASAAGAEVVRPVEEQFHGDVMATLKDPFGYIWFFATHIEDLEVDELAERSAEYEPTS